MGFGWDAGLPGKFPELEEWTHGPARTEGRERRRGLGLFRRRSWQKPSQCLPEFTSRSPARPAPERHPAPVRRATGGAFR